MGGYGLTKCTCQRLMEFTAMDHCPRRHFPPEQLAHDLAGATMSHFHTVHGVAPAPPGCTPRASPIFFRVNCIRCGPGGDTRRGWPPDHLPPPFSRAVVLHSRPVAPRPTRRCPPPSPPPPPPPRHHAPLPPPLSLCRSPPPPRRSWHSGAAPPPPGTRRRPLAAGVPVRAGRRHRTHRRVLAV